MTAAALAAAAATGSTPLLAAGLIAAAALIADAAAASRPAYSCVRGCGVVEAVAGGSVSTWLILSGRPDSVHAAGACRVSSVKGRVVLLEAGSRVAGEYECVVYASTRSPLGFFEAVSEAGRVLVKARPRVEYWAARLMRLGGVAGEDWRRDYAGGKGFLAPSGVYLETREYTPGLPWRRIDWRAYAATGRFMVKVYSWPYSVHGGGGEATIYLDGRCTGPYTCDSLASLLLSIAVSVFEEGCSVRLCRLGPRGVEGCRRVSPRDVLDEAMVVARGSREPATPLPYQYVSPADAAAALRLLGPAPLSVDAEGEAYIVSTLLAGQALAYRLVDVLRSHGIRVTVAAPAEPWLDGVLPRRVLEESLERTVSALENLGADVVLS